MTLLKVKNETSQGANDESDMNPRFYWANYNDVSRRVVTRLMVV